MCKMESDQLMNELQLKVFGKSKHESLRVANGAQTALDMGLVSQSRNVDLKVLGGTIYALVGGNACGKSFVLNSLVGIIKSKMAVTVIGEYSQSNSTIGFMPESLELYSEITVLENLIFFGRLQGLIGSVLKSRIKHYLHLFGLSSCKHALLGQICFSQKKLVSLTVALMHNPTFLFLDEPTLGLDVLKANLVWNLLFDLKTENKMTVVIATSIEDVKTPDLIGFLNNGKLMFQGTPEDILSAFNETSLEKCLLSICNRGMDEHLNINLDKFNQFETSNKLQKLIHRSAFSSSMFAAFTWINFIRLKHRPIAVFLQCVMPALTIIILGSCLDPTLSGLKFAIVNEEKEFLWGQKYIDTIDNQMFSKTSFNDFETALESVRTGDSIGVVHIGPEFSGAFMERMELCLSTSANTITNSAIRVYLDMSNQPVGMVAAKILLDGFQAFSKDLIQSFQGTPGLEELPILLEKPVIGTMNVNFFLLVMPIILILFSIAFPFCLTYSSISEDRKTGLLKRILACGDCSVAMVTSQIIPYSIIMIIQIALVMMYSFRTVEFSLQEVLLIFSILLVQGVYALCLGILVASMVDKPTTRLTVVIVYIFCTILLSGMLWPVSGQVTGMRDVSLYLPHTYPTMAIRAILCRTLSFGVTSWAFLVPIIWTVGVAVIAVILCKYR